MKLTFSKDSRFKAYKVFAWSMGSALVVLAISVLQQVNVSEQYVLLVSVANTVLFSIQQFMKENRPQEMKDREIKDIEESSITNK